MGDPDFSESRNRSIYKNAEKKSKENYERKQKMIAEGIAERVDVIYSYIRNQMQNKKDMPIEEYTGWHKMKELWGQTRVQELQELMRKKNLTTIKF